MRIGLLTPAGYPCGGRVSQAQAMDPETPSFDDLLETMKRCAAWLREADVDFVLAGSVAALGAGGPAGGSRPGLVLPPPRAPRAPPGGRPPPPGPRGPPPGR